MMTKAKLDKTMKAVYLVTVRGFNRALVIVYPFESRRSRSININVLAASKPLPAGEIGLRLNYNLE